MDEDENIINTIQFSLDLKISKFILLNENNLIAVAINEKQLVKFSFDLNSILIPTNTIIKAVILNSIQSFKN